MKTLKKLLWLAAVLLCIVSCSKEEVTEKVIEVPEGNNILSIIVVNDKTKLTSEIYRTNFIYHAQPGVEIEE